MNRTRHLFACVLFGCTSPSDTPPSPEQADASNGGPEGGGIAGAATPGQSADTPSEPPGVLLPRGIAHEGSITEVWLDPRASAALSLDAGGGVRLWPALPPAHKDLAALSPVRVPIHEPSSLSLARAGEHEFVIAAIDTAQSARVISIHLDPLADQGRARVLERFTIPPSDPLLELHALDGGDRLLALGVDHRLRLYDGHGKLLFELAEYGLTPWQLRLAGPPESPVFAMVLAGPTRLQRFTITNDHITRVGEPHPFTMDRGPNRNDLSLLPSGRVAALLRRPKHRTTQWSLELHDLESGEIRVMWGEVESELRPRLYLVDDERALLEDGSGAGFWIDLRGGVAMPAPFELPEKLEELPPDSHVSVRRVELPKSSVPNRRRASVVAGLRVVPLGSSLLLDPLDGERHHRLIQQSISVNDLALDRAGNQLAMAMNDGKIVVESLGESSRHVVVGCTTDPIWELEFTDPDHLMLVGEETAQICAWAAGKVISEIELPTSYGRQIRRTDLGSGHLAIVIHEDNEWDEDAPPHELSRASFTGNRFGALEGVPKAEVSDWPEIDNKSRSLALDHTGQRYSQPKVDTRQFEITTAGGEPRTLKISDDKIDIEEVKPSADGSRVAIVHSPHSEYDDYDYEYSYYSSYSAQRTLSVWSVASEIPELLWSTPADGSMDLSWSADGSRLALDMSPEVRVVTAQGEVLFERTKGELEVEEFPDVPLPEVPPASP